MAYTVDELIKLVNEGILHPDEVKEIVHADSDVAKGRKALEAKKAEEEKSKKTGSKLKTANGEEGEPKSIVDQRYGEPSPHSKEDADTIGQQGFGAGPLDELGNPVNAGVTIEEAQEQAAAAKDAAKKSK